jgi:hypothetical protein
MKKKGFYNKEDKGLERANLNKKNGGVGRFDRYLNAHIRPLMFDRLKWTPPKLSTEPLPMPDCPCCGKPIRDIATAINDKISGKPAHFDCIMAKVAAHERLEKGDTLAYIGNGKFGVVRFTGTVQRRLSKIVKIFEWEDQDVHAEWRKSVSDHYSLT